MQDEGIVTFRLGWDSAPKAAVLVVFSFLVSPFLQRKGWIGSHNVKVFQRLVWIKQLWIPQRIAPLNAMIVLAVQEHIHLGQCPGRTNRLLAVQGVPF